MTNRKTLDDWAPKPAERRLATEMGGGQVVEIGPGVPADPPSPDRVIRATFLRALILGQITDCPVPETGVRVEGAYIAGDGPEGPETRGLNLEACDLAQDLGLLACRLPDMLLLRSASLRNLYLNGSHLGAGLTGDRLEARGDVFLRDVVVQGGVWLPGAKLDGNLDFDGARLTPWEDGLAIFADRLDAKGNVSLRGVVAHGAVRLLGAKLGGDLDCGGAQLKAATDGEALDVPGSTVVGTFVLGGGARVCGILDLSGAEIGTIFDEPDCWPTCGNLILNGLTYKRIAGRVTSAKKRLEWLALQEPRQFGDKFWPQPYEQLATYYASHGLVRDAEQVRLARAHLERKAEISDFSITKRRTMGIFHYVHGFINGYGHRPFRPILLLALVFLIGVPLYYFAWDKGIFRPTSPLVLRSPEWLLCGVGSEERRFFVSLSAIRTGRAIETGSGRESQLVCYMRQRESQALPTFNAIFYSADAVVPSSILSLQDAWVPDEKQGLIGETLRYFLWIQVILGWVLSFFAVAGFVQLREGRRGD